MSQGYFDILELLGFWWHRFRRHGSGGLVFQAADSWQAGAEVSVNWTAGAEAAQT